MSICAIQENSDYKGYYVLRGCLNRYLSILDGKLAQLCNNLGGNYNGKESR